MARADTLNSVLPTGATHRDSKLTSDSQLCAAQLLLHTPGYQHCARRTSPTAIKMWPDQTQNNNRQPAAVSASTHGAGCWCQTGAHQHRVGPGTAVLSTPAAVPNASHPASYPRQDDMTNASRALLAGLLELYAAQRSGSTRTAGAESSAAGVERQVQLDHLPQPQADSAGQQGPTSWPGMLRNPSSGPVVPPGFAAAPVQTPSHMCGMYAPLRS